MDSLSRVTCCCTGPSKCDKSLISTPISKLYAHEQIFVSVFGLENMMPSLDYADMDE